MPEILKQSFPGSSHRRPGLLKLPIGSQMITGGFVMRTKHKSEAQNQIPHPSDIVVKSPTPGRLLSVGWGFGLEGLCASFELICA